MSGWISRNLTGIAQQVTTFTKEVINEANGEPPRVYPFAIVISCIQESLLKNGVWVAS